MAKDFLINGVTFAAGCTLTLSSCTSTFDYHPTENPREVGRKVEQLYREIFSGLIIKPDASTGVSSDYCGEDWNEERSVAPQNDDPWKVNHNYFQFLVGATIHIKSGYDAQPIYRALANHLQKIDGWKVQEKYSTKDFLAGINGQKEEVYLNVRHSPDKNRSISIYVGLESKCYKHPNA